MRITEKQIHAMISFLTTLMAHSTDSEFTMVTITSEGRNQIRDLLNEILSQQSDEIREIGDE